jgi:hypothetical protein
MYSWRIKCKTIILTIIYGWLLGWFLLPPWMIYEDLSWSLSILGKSRIHFWCGGTHKAGSITPPPLDRIIMKMVVGREDIQFNVGWEPRLGTSKYSPYSRSFIFVRGGGFILWAEKFPHISEDQTQNSLNESPVSYQKASRCINL